VLGTDLKREDYAAFPNKIVPDGTMIGYTPRE
jgi:hypothetical protein